MGKCYLSYHFGKVDCQKKIYLADRDSLLRLSDMRILDNFGSALPGVRRRLY
jgi:hypothetical protein